LLLRTSGNTIKLHVNRSIWGTDLQNIEKSDCKEGQWKEMCTACIIPTINKHRKVGKYGEGGVEHRNRGQGNGWPRKNFVHVIFTRNKFHVIGDI
jgi:hypothetical protein